MKKILNTMTIESIYNVLDEILSIKCIIKCIMMFLLVVFIPNLLKSVGVDPTKIPLDIVQSGLGFLCIHSLMSGQNFIK
jgi:hypothetical protein